DLDTASNRSSETVATTTTTSTPNNVNEITSQSGGVNRTLTYDLNGSITSDGGTRTFEWDGANRLVAINYTGFTTRSEFTYDGLNRVAKIVEKTGATINSTRKIVWLGQEMVEFRDATDVVTQRNYKQGQYVGTTAYFYTRDHLGSIREMFTGGGTVVARYDYDPYGRSTTVLGTTPTDFNFTGLYRHSKSNLDLAVYRAYDPDLGRWLNRDPISEQGGINLYAYVGNDPGQFLDPDGLARCLRDLIHAAVTAGVMTYQSLTGSPTDIKAPRTPTSERMVERERIWKERLKRPRKPSVKMRCMGLIGILYDPFEDFDFILDYDIDKSFDQNIHDKY